MTDKKSLTARILLIIYIIAVFVLCFANFSDTNGLEFPKYIFGIPMDKAVHFTMFLPYPLLMYYSFRRHDEKRLPFILFMIATFASGLAISGGTEIVQGLLGYRSEDPIDFLADCLGLLTGSFLTIVILFILKNR